MHNNVEEESEEVKKHGDMRCAACHRIKTPLERRVYDHVLRYSQSDDPKQKRKERPRLITLPFAVYHVYSSVAKTILVCTMSDLKHSDLTETLVAEEASADPNPTDTEKEDDPAEGTATEEERKPEPETTYQKKHIPP